MGVDISFVSKTRGDKQIYEILSRKFRNFASGTEVYGDNCELYQLGKICEIDLNKLSEFVDLEPPIYPLEGKLYVAEEEGDDSKIEEIKREIEEFEANWEKNYDNDLKGWIPLDEMESMIKQLNSKINEIDVNEQLHFNHDWEDYFTQKPIKKEWETRLTLDLEKILKSIQQVKELGEKYVGFSYG